MYVCMYVRMYVCMYVYYMYRCMYIITNIASWPATYLHITGNSLRGNWKK